MRKRNIKSIAHWVIMSIVLLFPILMVGVSSFAQKQQEIHVTETYEYETNEVNSVDDLVEGNIYKCEVLLGNLNENYSLLSKSLYYLNADVADNIALEGFYVSYLAFENKNVYIIGNTINYKTYVYTDLNGTRNFLQELDLAPETTLSFYFLYNQISDNLVPYVSASDYLGEHTIDYNITDQTMRDDVNEWCGSFRNLPVNQWYGNMLDTIGLGITNSMMMNVIYTYPLYVLWVYIIDLVVDCLLVIINFGHNALKRLGGDNE